MSPNIKKTHINNVGDWPTPGWGRIDRCPDSWYKVFVRERSPPGDKLNGNMNLDPSWGHMNHVFGALPAPSRGWVPSWGPILVSVRLPLHNISCDRSHGDNIGHRLDLSRISLGQKRVRAPALTVLDWVSQRYITGQYKHNPNFKLEYVFIS